MHSPNLDLLRALAVLLVLVDHLGTAGGLADLKNPTLVVMLFQVGQLGVSIFFVHTSLVLMHSLERRRESFSAFVVRRFFRIYPLSVTAVLIYAAVGDTPLLVSNLLLVQNINGDPSTPYPLWSLPYEVQMYLLLPALFAATFVLRARGVFILWCAAVILVLGAERIHPTMYRILQYVPCFLPGVLAFALRGRATLPSGVLFFGAVLPAVVALPLLVIAGLPITPLHWVTCLVIGVAVAKCRPFADGRLARAAQVVAKYSYGIYLLHPLFIVVAFKAMPGLPLPVRLLVFVGMLGAASWAAYQLIEGPGVALGVRLAERLRYARSPSSARVAVGAGSPPTST